MVGKTLYRGLAVLALTTSFAAAPLVPAQAAPRPPVPVTEDLSATAAPRGRQCAGAARAAGFRGERLVTAVAVGLAESGCSVRAKGHNGPTKGCRRGSTDRGLWQINSCYHPDVPDSCAYNANCNARAAHRISKGGTQWKWWSSYQNGSYRKYLNEARAALR